MRFTATPASQWDAARGKAPRMTRSTPTILVADDDAGIVRIVSRVLELNDFTVVACGDGNEALRLLRQESPSLALLDIRMPGLDGNSPLPEAAG